MIGLRRGNLIDEALVFIVKRVKPGGFSVFASIAFDLQLWLYYYGIPLLAVLGFCGLGLAARNPRYGGKRETILLLIVGLGFLSILGPLPFEFYRMEREMFCKDTNPEPVPPSPSSFTAKSPESIRAVRRYRARSVKVSACAQHAQHQADNARAISFGLLPFALILGLSSLLVMRATPGPERPEFATFCFLGCAVIFIFWEGLAIFGI